GCRPVLAHSAVLKALVRKPSGRNPRGLVGRSLVFGDSEACRLTITAVWSPIAAAARSPQRRASLLPAVVNGWRSAVTIFGHSPGAELCAAAHVSRCGKWT